MFLNLSEALLAVRLFMWKSEIDFKFIRPGWFFYEPALAKVGCSLLETAWWPWLKRPTPTCCL